MSYGGQPAMKKCDWCGHLLSGDIYHSETCKPKPREPSQLEIQSAHIESLQQENAELKRELDTAKQNRAHTKCPECGNQGVFSYGIQLLDELSALKDENTQLQSRVRELENENQMLKSSGKGWT